MSHLPKTWKVMAREEGHGTMVMARQLINAGRFPRISSENAINC